jgi:hypothetical protein
MCMPQINSVREVLIPREVSEILSWEKIREALVGHEPEKYFSFHPHLSEKLMVVTDEDGITRVLLCEKHSQSKHNLRM